MTVREAPTGWRIAGSAFSVLVLLIGAGLAAATAAQQSSDTTVSCLGVRKLVVEAGAGRLTVRRGGPAVLVHRHLTWSWFRPHVEERQDGTTLTLRADCSEPVSDRAEATIAINCVADYTIEVPRELEITASTAEGIAVHDVTGPVDLTCTEGSITVTGAGGPVTARTGPGDVAVGFAQPPSSANLTSDQGDIRLVVPPDSDYQISSSRLSERRTRITVVHEPAAGHRLTTHTGSGSISIDYGPTS
ncbi:MAG: hypothetical protein ABW000_10400 [Actinoplanes sp.]